MAYSSGTITDANPGAAMRAKIEDVLRDHAGLAWVASTSYATGAFVRGTNTGVTYRFEATTGGTSGTTEPTWPTALGATVTDGGVTWTNRGRATWEFVEEITIGTVLRRVWRNRGSDSFAPNAFGQDFYIQLASSTTAGDTNVWLYAFEHWDATNKKVIRPCKHTASLTPNANGSWGDEVNGYTLDSASLTYMQLTSLPATGFEYNVLATKDQVWIGGKVGSNDFCASMGLFESFLASEPFPLFMNRGRPNSSSYFMSNFASTSASYGSIAWSRHPNVTASQTFNFMGELTAINWRIGGVGSTDSDKFHGGILYGRYGVVSAPSSTPRSSYGYGRGKLRDTVSLAAEGASTRVGDTVTLGSDVYIVYPINRDSGAAAVALVKRDAA